MLLLDIKHVNTKKNPFKIMEKTPTKHVEKTGDNGGNNITPNIDDVSNKVLEKLYHRYSIKQRRAGLGCFLAASILFDLWAIFVPQGQRLESLGKVNFFLFLLFVIY